MPYISIRDLQKISGEGITALPGPTPIKSGDKTVGILVPIKPVDLVGLAATLKKAEMLARRRDPTEDEAFLAGFGNVDQVRWTGSEVRRDSPGQPRRSKKRRRR